MKVTIKDTPVYPSGIFTGITYREWLIGQIAAGFASDADSATVPSSGLAIATADKICEQLENERSRNVRQRA